MAESVFTKDVMLDLLVNIIPLGIMAFFMGLFVVWGPFSWDPLYSTLMLGIIGGAFVLLSVLTYVSAVAIEGDANERKRTEREARADVVAEAETTDGGTEADASGDDADDETAATDGDEEYEEVF